MSKHKWVEEKRESAVLLSSEGYTGYAETVLKLINYIDTLEKEIDANYRANDKLRDKLADTTDRDTVRDLLHKRIAELEKENREIKVKVPGPMDVALGGTIYQTSLPNKNGYCTFECQLLSCGGRATYCRIGLSHGDGRGSKPGPLCPAYRLQAVKAAWGVIEKLGGWR